MAHTKKSTKKELANKSLAFQHKPGSVPRKRTNTLPTGKSAVTPPEPPPTKKKAPPRSASGKQKAPPRQHKLTTGEQKAAKQLKSILESDDADVYGVPSKYRTGEWKAFSPMVSRKVVKTSAHAAYSEIDVHFGHAKKADYGEILARLAMLPRNCLGYDEADYLHFYTDMMDEEQLSNVMVMMRENNHFKYPPFKITDARIPHQLTLYNALKRDYNGIHETDDTAYKRNHFDGCSERLKVAGIAVWGKHYSNAIKFFRDLKMENPDWSNQYVREQGILILQRDIKNEHQYNTYFTNRWKAKREAMALDNLKHVLDINTDTDEKMDVLRTILLDLQLSAGGKNTALVKRLKDWISKIPAADPRTAKWASFLKEELAEAPKKRAANKAPTTTTEPPAKASKSTASASPASATTKQAASDETPPASDSTKPDGTPPATNPAASDPTKPAPTGGTPPATTKDPSTGGTPPATSKTDAIVDDDETVDKDGNPNPSSQATTSDKPPVTEVATSTITTTDETPDGDKKQAAVDNPTSKRTVFTFGASGGGSWGVYGSRTAKTVKAKAAAKAASKSDEDDGFDEDFGSDEDDDEEEESSNKTQSFADLKDINDVSTQHLLVSQMDVRDKVEHIFTIANSKMGKKDAVTWDKNAKGKMAYVVKDPEWVDVHKWLFSQICGIMDDLTVQWGVEFKTKNIQNADKHILSAARKCNFINSGQIKNKKMLEDSLKVWLPPLMLLSFSSRMLALEHWLGPHTTGNNKEEQARKFALVKTVVFARNLPDDKVSVVLRPFKRIADWDSLKQSSS